MNDPVNTADRSRGPFSDEDRRDDGRDPEVFLTMVNTIRRRRSVPVKAFYPYWRDAHVQIASRLLGTHSLWNHWVAFDQTGALWPRIDGVEWWAPETLRFDGIPEPTFATAADFALFVPNIGPLMADEQNFLEESISYQSRGGHTRTVIDRLVDPASAGKQGVLRLMVFLQRAPDQPLDAFQRWFGEDFSAELARDPQVLKLRHHILEPYDNARLVLDAGADSVSHFRREEDQYHAVLEIVFADRAGLGAFAEGAAWQRTVEKQRIFLRAAHAYRARRTYCPRLNGELTTVGLRTAAVAEQIRALGATNQLSDEVRHLILTGRPLKEEPALPQ